ncbi:MAG: hypothetical protein OIN83_01890 [Candidatus Methanoperedens sp.]|nr:hypothetical protein [Candidatus Methanoperedens sp.]
MTDRKNGLILKRMNYRNGVQRGKKAPDFSRGEGLKNPCKEYLCPASIKQKSRTKKS